MNIKSYKFRAWCYVYEYHLERIYNIVNRCNHFRDINILDFVKLIRANSSGKLSPYLR